MIKLDLNKAAEEFDKINQDTHVFYNTQTGEFALYGSYMDDYDDDPEEFEGDEWIAAPTVNSLNEYSMMEEFAEGIRKRDTRELLLDALVGKNVFRRFRYALKRVGLIDKWYVFRQKCFVDAARNWCDFNGIEYVERIEKVKSKHK